MCCFQPRMSLAASSEEGGWSYLAATEVTRQARAGRRKGGGESAPDEDETENEALLPASAPEPPKRPSARTQPPAQFDVEAGHVILEEREDLKLRAVHGDDVIEDSDDEDERRRFDYEANPVTSWMWSLFFAINITSCFLISGLLIAVMTMARGYSIAYGVAVTSPVWLFMNAWLANVYWRRTPTKFLVRHDRFIVVKRAFGPFNRPAEFHFETFRPLLHVFCVPQGWRDGCMIELPALLENGYNYATDKDGFVKIRRKCSVPIVWDNDILLTCNTYRRLAFMLKSAYDAYVMRKHGGMAPPEELMVISEEEHLVFCGEEYPEGANGSGASADVVAPTAEDKVNNKDLELAAPVSVPPVITMVASDADDDNENSALIMRASDDDL